MSLISAKLTDKIYFSYKEEIKNNFSFEIRYSVDNSQIYNNLIKSIKENDTLSIYIEGIQKLFKKTDDLNNFAEALKAKNLVKGWNVLYDDDGLIITHSADILKNDFSILFNTEYEFNADFNDNDSILIKVYFYFPASTEDPIHQNFSIKVYEMPCINSFTVTNSKGKETQSIIKGHTASIQWKTNISDSHQGSVALYDENNNKLNTNEVTIDKDCKFTLVVTKHEKEISRNISIKAVYIEKIDVLNSEGNSVKAIYKGHKVTITWSLVNGENAKISLLDEKRNPASNEVIIDRDRTFTLEINQDDDIQSQEITIKSIYVEKIDILDLDNNNVKAIYKGEKAKINWSLINGESAKVSLLDETGNEINPNEIIIDKNRTLALKIEINGDIATEPFQIYRTLWKKDQCTLNTPFKADDKGYNRILKFFHNCDSDGYYVFIHPKIYYSKDILEWFEYAEDPNPLKEFDYYSYCFYYDNLIEYRIAGWCIYTNRSKNDFMTKYFRKDDVKEADYFKKIYPLDNQKKILLINFERERYYCFEAYEHSINFYAPNGPSFHDLFSIPVPDDAKIISFDILFNGKSYLAILCNNNHIYIYEIVTWYDSKIHTQYDLIRTLTFDRSDQKRIYLIQTDSIYIVLDNYVFELNGNKDLSETHFSPLETTKENQGTMIIGPKDNNSFAAIVQDGDNASLWTYG